MVWLNYLMEDFLYYALQEFVQVYGYVRYGIIAYVTILGPIWVEHKGTKNWFVANNRKQYDKYQGRLAPACCDNYIIMLKGKYIYIYFSIWNENYSIELDWIVGWNSLIPKEIATMWLEQDSWSCKSNRCALQSFWSRESLWCTKSFDCWLMFDWFHNIFFPKRKKNGQLLVSMF